MDDRLWPARNVAEHIFCPRLFYLMEVEGLHLHNSETLQGQLVHRKVDQPSKEKTTATAQDKDIPKSLRSLTLTSTLYSLTATLDLAKIDGNLATPIEYRKGRPQRKNISNVPFEEIAIIGPSKLQKIYDNKFANIGLSTIANRLHEDGIPYNLRYALTKKTKPKQ